MYIKLNWQKGMAYNLFDFGRKKKVVKRGGKY